MFKLNDYELLEYIKEDVPYFDLTTTLQDISKKKAKMQIFTRENIVVSCSEESARVAELLGCNVEFFLPSKSFAKEGDILLEFSGDYESVQSAWRVTQQLLEYSCKIATYAHQMKSQIDEVNSRCELLVTRKHFPFAKKFCIKSIMCGGAMPHRLGLGETVLFFAHHRKIYRDNAEFYEAIKDIKIRAVEKKIVVEPQNIDDAIALMECGVDVLQIDKSSIENLKIIISHKDKNHPNVRILAAGGVNIKNAKDFAQTGVDGIVTSSIYFCGMADMGSRLEIVK